MSSATFHHDKTVLPIAHYPEGRPNSVYSPSRPVQIASGSSLGLFAFASTSLILSLYNTNILQINKPNAVVGMALFCGGLGQFVAGIWEFPRGNAFGATVFTLYGTFWMSYATILIPGSGIVDAYGTNTAEFNNAVGIYLTVWSLVTFMFATATLRTSIAHIALFIFLGLTFGILGLSDLHGTASTGAGGVLGILTSFIAYYIGLSDLLAADENSPFIIPLGTISNIDGD